MVICVLLLGTLVATLGVPLLHGWAQGLLRLLVSLLFGYTLFMATVWNRLERAGITAGMCDLRVALNRCSYGSCEETANSYNSCDETSNLRDVTGSDLNTEGEEKPGKNGDL